MNVNEQSMSISENMPTTRDEKGKWIKGFCPNPAGRPQSLWPYLNKKTNNGREIIDTVYGILKKSKNDKCKLEAARILLHAGGYISLRSADGMDMPGNDNTMILMLNFFKAIDHLSKDEQLRDRLTEVIEGAKTVPATELLQDKNQEPEANQPQPQ